MTDAILLVADSFRVHADGTVSGWPLHRQRFERGVLTMLARVPAARAHPIQRQLETFLNHAEHIFRETGSGFPRLELWSTQEELRLHLALRPLPPLEHSISLVSVAVSDVAGLTDVVMKGPNIAVHTELVTRHGSEVLLIDHDNTVIEGARTAIVWWHDDTLVRVSNDQRVASVTEQLIVNIAMDEGMTVEPRQITSEALCNFEVWAVNALHGIRVVTAIDGRRTSPQRADRLQWFRAQLRNGA